MAIMKLDGLKLPAPGGWTRIGGPGVLPQGAYATGAATRVSGDWIPGQLGQEFEIPYEKAAGFKTEFGKSLTATERATQVNFGGCRVQQVRGYGSSTGAIAAGKLVFLQDRANYVVTPDPDANVGLAVGVALWTPTNKDDYLLIVNLGDVEALGKATLTNASTAGKPVYAVSDSSLGRVDGLADATAISNIVLATYVGKALETLANNTLKRIYFDPRVRMI